jgi:hypothetical protein
MTQPFPKTYQEARWFSDLDPSGAETASDLESLEQDVAHIIVETLGSNGADPNNGVGALNYLSGSTVVLGYMPAVIDAQLASVSRITTSKTTLALQGDGSYIIAVAAAVAGQVIDFNFSLGPNGLSSVKAG